MSFYWLYLGLCYVDLARVNISIYMHIHNFICTLHGPCMHIIAYVFPSFSLLFPLSFLFNLFLLYVVLFPLSVFSCLPFHISLSFLSYHLHLFSFVQNLILEHSLRQKFHEKGGGVKTRERRRKLKQKERNFRNKMKG